VEGLKCKNPVALPNFPSWLEFGDEYTRTAKKDKTTYHNARTTYANVCDILFNVRQGNKGRAVTQNYLTTILGHSMDDRSVSETAEDYAIFAVDDFRGLSFEDFKEKTVMINGQDWTNSEVLKLNNIEE
jgi:hypothetical protein